MLVQWMILAAALGQTTTRPATPPPAARPTRVASTRPAAGATPLASLPKRAASTRPAATMPVAARPPAPAIRVSSRADRNEPKAPARPARAAAPPRPTRAAAPAATTQPALGIDLAEIGEAIPPLSGDPIELHATSTGELIISATDPDMAILERLIQLMDTQAPGLDRVHQIVALKYQQATDIAPNVKKFWDELKRPADGRIRPEDTLTIVPDPRANLLMLATSTENMDTAQAIIEALDIAWPGAEGAKFTVIPLTHIKAAEAEAKVKELLESLRKQRGVDKELVSIKADVRTSSLLVSARDRELEQIRQLIALIDVPVTEATGGVVKVALVPLRKAKASDLADALNKILAGETDVAKAMNEQIRQLQIRLVEENNRELSPVDLDKPIKIFAEPGTNALVVASVEANLEPLLEVVRILDTMPVADDLMVRIFPLKYADAETLQADLQSVFDKGRQLPKHPGREDPGRVPPGLAGGLVYDIDVVADKRTNAVVVAGRLEQLALVEQIVRAVDVEESANKFPIRMIKLENADVRRIREVAEKLAEQREQMAERLGTMAKERERILLIDDVRTNSLIVVASEENYEDIQDLASRLDSLEADWLGDIRIINLENLTAADIASKIEDLWQRRADLRREGGLPEDKPVLVTDSRSNSLVIASNKEDYTAIERLINQLEQQKLSPMLDIHQIILKHHDAAKMSEMLQKLFDERLKNSLAKGEEEQPSDRIFVVEDPLTNMLLFVASKKNHQEILDLVTRLDVPPSVDGLIRVFYVKNVDVSKAREIIQDMFDKGLYRGSSGDRELPESMTKVTVVADDRSSALIVSASPENFAIVDTILKEIDRVDVPFLQTEARFFDIAHADVVNVADTLTQLLEGMGKTIEDSKQLQFTVVPETRGKRVVIVGTRLAMQRAEELVPKLDREGPDVSSVKVYQLIKASAPELSEKMTKLFDERASESQGEHTPIAIIPDGASNSLLVTASPDDHQMIAHLLTLLDVESTLAQRLEIFPLAKAKADQLQEVLNDLLEQQNLDQEAGWAISAEPRTNSLVVWAAPDMMVHIRKIVEKLDNTRPTQEMALRVFKLYNAKADQLAEMLNDFFDKAGTGTGDDAKQMIINFISGTSPETGKAVIEKLVHQDVTITPDENTNALLVMAPEGSIDMMQMLVEMLDSVEPEPIAWRVFELRSADATQMRDLLEKLFESKKGEDQVRQFAIGGEGGGAVSAGGGAALELAFAVDERTNTLIAAGSPSYLRMVESLVYRLDYQDIDERIVKIVHLNHRTASDVAKTLQDFLKEETSLIKEAVGEEAKGRALQREVTIIEANQSSTGAEGGSNRESNTLMVAYSPRMESQVIRMINELDQPIPQVMIQVLMAEVTLTDNFELGMEFAMQDLLFSETASINANTGLPQGGNYDFVFGTDVGAAGASGLGGMSFTVTGEDFAFLLRALQSEGRVEILSRPAIMVQDGQEATINIGEQVPTVQDVVVSVGGVVTPSVSYVDVGIKLVVTPIINPDGYVNMHIEPEISAIGQSSVSIGAGITLPIFTKRNAITDVTVRDAETIIIGGLITSRENDSESKVPLAGDIPLLGSLFRSTVQATTRTELLIVLTPHVVRVAEDARTVSEQMRDQTGLNENIRHSPLMQGLQVQGPLKEFGPDDKTVSPSKSVSPAKPNQDSGPAGHSDEFGPELEEYGPAASSIKCGTVEPAVAVRNK